MHRHFPILALLLASACGDERAETSDAEKIAEVERANVAPAVPIEPQPMRFIDLERADMLGAGCSFLASDRPDGLLFVAMDNRGAMKIDGEIRRYAPDRGGQRIGYGAWRQYDGLENSVRLEMGEPSAIQSDSEVVDHAGTMTVRDGRDRVVFEAEGTIQCGS